MALYCDLFVTNGFCQNPLQVLYENCHKSILSTSFKLILKLYYQPDETFAVMMTVGTLEQPEHVQYLPNLSQISFVTIHLT